MPDDDECTCPECDAADRLDEDGYCDDRACSCGQIDPACPVHGHRVWTA